MAKYSKSFTKKGPGRKPHRRSHPAGTKLIKRFIEGASNEVFEYRAMLRRLAPNDPLVRHLAE